jgi:tetratricopeptide (TPR) repeat protein
LHHFRQAAQHQPTFWEAHYNLGVTLRNLGRIDEAVPCFQEALRLNPSAVNVHNQLGLALQLAGRTDDALSQLQQAMRVDAHNPTALAYLSNLVAAGYYHFRDREIQAVEDLLARRELSAADRCRLHFALARVYDSAGAPDEAFAHCHRGNELSKEIERSRGRAFDRDDLCRHMDRLIGACMPAYFQRVAGFGSDSEVPVFVVGMPRSGTTLAEQILASHPQVCGAGELPHISKLATETLLGYPESLTNLDAMTALNLAGAYLVGLQKYLDAAPTCVRVVDKYPGNFVHLGLIVTLFPRARIIHCRRDPVDTCFSCYFQQFLEPYLFDLDLRHVAQYYSEYDRLMARWREVLPVPMFELRYEVLTSDQEPVTRRLLAFCGLDWDERCLRFHETRRPVLSASALQVRRPMYQTSVGRWKRYEPYLKPLLEELGMDASHS